MMASSPIDSILPKLKGVKRNGSSHSALCPAHEDHNPSLSVSVAKDRRVLLHCHRGCSTEAVCQALGIRPADLFAGEPPNARGVSTTYALPRPHENPINVATYSYTDEHGVELFQTLRYEPKTFRQRQPDGKGDWQWNLNGARLVPYRLPQIIESIALGRMVWVVEGEKDADALSQAGYSATTNPLGAGKWREEYSRYFRNASVAVIPDNDDAGRAHAEQVAASLTNVGARVRMVTLPNLPPKGDVSDWLAQATDTDVIAELSEKAPTWQPDPNKRTRWRLDEILENEELMRPPVPLVPMFAWLGRSTLLAAREKAGKSTLARYLASEVSRGGKVFGERCQRGTVLYFAFEEHVADVARQFRHFRAEAEHIHVVTRLMSDGGTRVEEVRSHIEAVRPQLVIVDTFMAYASGQVTEATSSAQMQPVIDGLTSLAHEFGCAAILIHHGRKEDGAYRDSTAIGAGVDILIEIDTPNEQEDPTLRRVKARGRLPVTGFKFRYDGEAYHLELGEKPPLDRQILAVINERPGCSANDVADAVRPVRRETALNMIARLVADGQVVRYNKQQLRLAADPSPDLLTP